MSNESIGGLLILGSAAFLLSGTATPTPNPVFPPPNITPTGSYRMISVPLWHTPIDPIDFTAINEVTVFAMVPDVNGNLVYPAGLNPASVVQLAHQNGATAYLGIGGAGTISTVTAYQSIVTNSTAMTNFINNAMNEVQRLGYDGIHMDFENRNQGDFSGAGYVNLLQQLSARCKPLGIKIDLTFATWENISIPYQAIEPYVDRLLYAFSLNGLQTVQQIASTLKDPSKLQIGYDLASADTLSYHVPTSAEIKSVLQSGHGVFFWATPFTASTNIYSLIKAAMV